MSWRGRPGVVIDASREPMDATKSFEVTLTRLRRERRRRRIRRLSLVTGSTVLVLTLAVGGFIVTQRNATTTVSLDEATRQFRAALDHDPATAAPVAVPDGGDAGATDAAQPSLQPTQDAAPVPAEAAQAPAVAGPYVLPAEGIYTYKTTGGEKVSLFGASHTYPAQNYATVRHTGGCNWEHTNQVIAEHVDRRVICNKPGSTSQMLQERRITFFGQTDGAAVPCDPGVSFHRTGDAKGAKDQGVCIDSNNSKITLDRTFIGVESYTIDGKKIDALHTRINSTFEGKAVGTAVDDLWITQDTGITLKWVRSVDTDAKAFGATVHYTENASFTLLSLTPQT